MICSGPQLTGLHVSMTDAPSLSVRHKRLIGILLLILVLGGSLSAPSLLRAPPPPACPLPSPLSWGRVASRSAPCARLVSRLVPGGRRRPAPPRGGGGRRGAPPPRLVPHLGPRHL